MDYLDYTLRDIVYEQKPYDNALQLVPEKVMNRLNMLSTDIKKWDGSHLSMDIGTREDYQMYFSSTLKSSGTLLLLVCVTWVLILRGCRLI